MLDVPADTPETIPVVPIVATPVLALVHVPPPVASASVVVAPVQTVRVPVMAAGVVLTVTILVAKQPPLPI